MALNNFHPACQSWFNAQFGAPTVAQTQAWPAIQAGRHTLISAPTGSGKTLAAFYAAIDSLVQRGLNRQLGDGVQILYVSPLKALSNDIHKNLEIPLDGIAEQLFLAAEAPVDIMTDFVLYLFLATDISKNSLVFLKESTSPSLYIAPNFSD